MNGPFSVEEKARYFDVLTEKLGGPEVVSDILTSKTTFKLAKLSLLEPLGSIEIPPNQALGPFSKKDLNIVCSNDLFDTEILSHMGRDSEVATVRQHKLLETSGDTRILTELGADDDPNTISLSADQFRVWLQTAQKNRWHIVYVKGKADFHGVSVCWDDNGWLCGASSSPHPSTWFPGRVIISR